MRNTILIGLLLVVGFHSTSATTPEEDRRVAFALSLRTAAEDGRLNALGPTSEMQYDNDEPLPGHWYTWEFYAKDLERCGTGLNAPVADQASAGQADAVAQWFVRFRLVERTREGAAVETELRRVISGGPDAGTLERRRTLRLAAGEPTPIDAWFADGRGGPCSFFVLEGQAKFVEPPSVADAHLAYDVWLVHRGSDGQQSRHLVTSAGQGASVDYAFAPLRFGSDGMADAGGPVRLSVSGSLRGRARVDGGIDLVVDMVHGFGDEQSGSSSSGRKFLQVSSGETVEIEVPSLAASEGITHLEPAFGAHQTALRITPRRTF